MGDFKVDGEHVLGEAFFGGGGGGGGVETGEDFGVAQQYWSSVDNLHNDPLAILSIVFMWQGAEARVEVVQEGRMILKTRFSKQYRHEELDKRLTRQRTINEARALYRAFCKGLPVPSVFWTEPDLGLLVMEYIEGTVTVKEALWKCDNDDGDLESRLASQIGGICARMHHNDLVHGDLTTSNFLYQPDSGLVYLIDFGLAAMSTSVEDKAVDLYVLERAIQSTHSVQHPNFFASVYKCYEETLCELDTCGKLWNGVKKRFEEVRARGRKRT